MQEKTSLGGVATWGGYTRIMPLDHLFHMLMIGEFPGVRVSEESK